MALKRASCLCG